MSDFYGTCRAATLGPIRIDFVLRRREFIAMTAGVMLAGHAAHAQQNFEAARLATYRLSEPVLQRFAHATRLIGKVLRADARFQKDPLITREIWVTGEAVEMATALQQRLESEAALGAALFAADISSHEYVTFAIALFGAHLAHGFVKSGAMRRVPAGIAAENVAFVSAHETEIAALLKQLNLE
jgi:hypothetical protein